MGGNRGVRRGGGGGGGEEGSKGAFTHGRRSEQSGALLRRLVD